MTHAISHLLAGIRVADLEVAVDWYTRFFGRAPDMNPAPGYFIWDVSEHGTVFLEEDAERAGASRVSFVVPQLDEALEPLTSAGIEHEPIETYSNRIRSVVVHDPDGNTLALVEFPVDPERPDLVEEDA